MPAETGGTAGGSGMIGFGWAVLGSCSCGVGVRRKEFEDVGRDVLVSDLGDAGRRQSGRNLSRRLSHRHGIAIRDGDRVSQILSVSSIRRDI
jgi:hypothetical protein